MEPLVEDLGRCPGAKAWPVEYCRICMILERSSVLKREFPIETGVEDRLEAARGRTFSLPIIELIAAVPSRGGVGGNWAECPRGDGAAESTEPYAWYPFAVMDGE